MAHGGSNGGASRNGPWPSPDDRPCGPTRCPGPDPAAQEEIITTPDRPSGQVTFLLTDIEGSTRLLQQLGASYAPALAQHHRLLRSAISGTGGIVVSTEGDSFFAVFRDPGSAARAAVDAQRRIAAADWPDGVPFPVRMGLHTGEIDFSDGEYVGVELHRAARIAATAHGGQIVASSATRDAIIDRTPPGTSLRDLGEHRLRDFAEPVHLYQLDVDGLRADFPPLASLSARFEILPPDLTPFVGRDEEIGAISRLLASSRILTMTGPGGTGKTRLAIQVARHCADSYPHGVAFVPLADLSDASLVATTIRGTLGFAEEPGRKSIETLVDRLRDHELLLILDNFEHLLPATATVTALIEGAGHLSVLVTSRTVLHVEGEQEFAVPPLGIPRPGSLDVPEEIAASPSVQLFVDRARRVRPDFDLDSADARTIALICQRLDGLPLAIELAAARIKLLSPAALLSRLERRLEALDSARGSGGRRRTLRGAIEWSYEQLSPDEQATFYRLAVFTGGATLEAVEDVLSTLEAKAAAKGRDVLDPIGSLVDHSLLSQSESLGQPRYTMLETIREYGLERLAESGEADVLAAEHARWYLARVHELAPGFTAGPDGLDQVEADHANVRAALTWTIEHDRTDEALSAVADLWRFWHLRGHLHEGLRICEEVAAMPGASEASEAAAGAIYAQASLLYWQGRSGEALEGYRRSLDVARIAGARAREAEAQFALAFAAGILRSWQEGHAAAAAAEAIYAEIGDDLGATNARFTNAYISSLEGDWEQAAGQLRAVLAEVDAHGDRFWALNTRIVLAWTLTRLERVDEARDILGETMRGSIELGDRSMENMAVQALATIAALDGDMERALRLAGAADAIADDLGGRAPAELVIGLEPVTLATERGIPADRADRLAAAGRSLGTEAARKMALDVAAGS